MPTKTSGNAGDSWWTSQLAINDGSADWFTLRSNAGAARVVRNNVDSPDNYTTLETNASYDDDHNAPALCIDSGKKSLAFTTRHGADSVVKQYEITYGGGVVGNNYEKDITFSGTVSYAQALCYGDTIVLFTRVGGGKWSYKVSTNRGDSWSGATDFINPTGDSIYVMFKPSSTAGVWHFVAQPHSSSTNFPFLNYGTVNLDTGDIQTLVSGSMATIDNLYSPTTLPFDETDLFDINPCQNSAQKSRVYTVGEVDGKVAVFHIKHGNGISYGLYYAVLHGGTFEKEPLRNSEGDPILMGGEWAGSPSGTLYTGGAELLGDSIGICIEDGVGTSRFKQYTLSFNAGTGEFETVYDGQLDSNAENSLVRPIASRGAFKWLYQELRAYASYTDYTIWKWIVSKI